MNVQYLLETYGFWPFVIALATMVLTSLAKIPVKLITVKIKSVTVRGLVERLILLIPVGIGIGLCYLKSHILKSGEDGAVLVIMGAYCGALAIIYYNFFGKYLERVVFKLFKLDTLIGEDTLMNAKSLSLAKGIAAGKPLENVVKELVVSDESKSDSTEVDGGLYDGSDRVDKDEVIKRVQELTGCTDEELIATILEKLKS